jgi:hypothetical protein
MNRLPEKDAVTNPECLGRASTASVWRSQHQYVAARACVLSRHFCSLTPQSHMFRCCQAQVVDFLRTAMATRRPWLAASSRGARTGATGHLVDQLWPCPPSDSPCKHTTRPACSRMRAGRRRVGSARRCESGARPSPPVSLRSYNTHLAARLGHVPIGAPHSSEVANAHTHPSLPASPMLLHRTQRPPHWEALAAGHKGVRPSRTDGAAAAPRARTSPRSGGRSPYGSRPARLTPVRSALGVPTAGRTGRAGRRRRRPPRRRPAPRPGCSPCTTSPGRWAPAPPPRHHPRRP